MMNKIMNKMQEKFPLPWPIICDITEHDILQGQRCSHSQCPATLALTRYAKEKGQSLQINIGRHYSTIYCPTERVKWTMLHPKELRAWIRDFDSLEEVKPERFEIASDALRRWKDPITD